MDSNDNFHNASIELGRMMEENAINLSKMVIRCDHIKLRSVEIYDSIESRLEILDL